ncbi:MAG: glycerol kinase GlpK [Anaerolineae bacterium]|nr:glycerol kinase GlpK [Anaerolineae bacterium]
MKILFGIDHGTTRTKALALDSEMRVVAQSASELPQIYPQPGWVEQHPADILRVTTEAITGCLAALPPGATVAAVGLANQGETALVWDRQSGAPVYDAIVWQDRRTAKECAALLESGVGARVRPLTGVVIDPYFSATKIRWILDHIPNGHARANAGELVIGTTDTWLLWNLSRRRLHLTDVTTASRTLLSNLETLTWDAELLDLFDIPSAGLARLCGCAEFVGEIFAPGHAGRLPVMGLMVDQQAALFGHGCLTPGMVKVTYGTGTFALMNIGAIPKLSRQGLLTTAAWQVPGERAYALDGGIYTTGAAVQWLVEEMGILATAQESATVAKTVPDNGGVFLVPALAGLAAPFWDTGARGLMIGMTRATTRAHIVRATLEGIAYRVRDVLDAMQTDAGIPFRTLRVDGGAAQNSFLMQFQSDILNVPIEVAATGETTARGAALLAGLGLGWWTMQDISQSWQPAAVYEPVMGEDQRAELYSRWQRAVQRAQGWKA